MGLLYDTVMEAKRKYLIEELTKMNVTQSRDGRKLSDLSYDELKEELVLATFRYIDRQNEAGKWF
jgi:hypothetical protein